VYVCYERNKNIRELNPERILEGVLYMFDKKERERPEK